MAFAGTKPDLLSFAGLTCVAFCIITFAVYEFHYGVNPDNAALAEFSRRMLMGGTMGVDFADTNPPLSILLYLPAAALSFIMPLYHGITAYAFLLLGLSLFLSAKILEYFTFLRPSERLVFPLAFAAAALAMGNIYFGERDQLILFGLVPLLLAQFAINENINLPRRYKIPSLVFGAIAILVKPHYGLMPTLLIAWRVFERKNPKDVLKSDFIILTIATLIYAAINAFFFSAYWTGIFPDVLRSYVAMPVATIASKKFLLLLPVIVLLLFSLCCRPMNQATKLMLMLGAACVALIIAYLTQYKGYYYQLLPALILTFATGTMLLSSLLHHRQREIYVLLPAIAFLFAAFPVRAHYPSHGQYANLPLGLMLKDCKEPCTFFVNNDYNYMSFETALDVKAFHASRFSVLWFQPWLSCAGKGPGDTEYDKYTRMIAEDFKHWKPQVVLLLKESDSCPDGHEIPFDFVKFFGRDKNFATEWKNYDYFAALDFDRAMYFPDTPADTPHAMGFDVYKRKAQ